MAKRIAERHHLLQLDLLERRFGARRQIYLRLLQQVQVGRYEREGVHVHLPVHLVLVILDRRVGLEVADEVLLLVVVLRRFPLLQSAVHDVLGHLFVVELCLPFPKIQYLVDDFDLVFPQRIGCVFLGVELLSKVTVKHVAERRDERHLGHLKFVSLLQRFLGDLEPIFQLICTGRDEVDRAVLGLTGCQELDVLAVLLERARQRVSPHIGAGPIAVVR